MREKQARVYRGRWGYRRKVTGMCLSSRAGEGGAALGNIARGGHCAGPVRLLRKQRVHGDPRAATAGVCEGESW